MQVLRQPWSQSDNKQRPLSTPSTPSPSMEVLPAVNRDFQALEMQSLTPASIFIITIISIFLNYHADRNRRRDELFFKVCLLCLGKILTCRPGQEISWNSKEGWKTVPSLLVFELAFSAGLGISKGTFRALTRFLQQPLNWLKTMFN